MCGWPESCHITVYHNPIETVENRKCRVILLRLPSYRFCPKNSQVQVIIFSLGKDEKLTLKLRARKLRGLRNNLKSRQNRIPSDPSYTLKPDHCALGEQWPSFALPHRQVLCWEMMRENGACFLPYQWPCGGTIEMWQKRTWSKVRIHNMTFAIYILYTSSSCSVDLYTMIGYGDWWCRRQIMHVTHMTGWVLLGIPTSLFNKARSYHVDSHLSPA